MCYAKGHPATDELSCAQPKREEKVLAVQFASSYLHTGIMHDLANYCHHAVMCMKCKEHFHV